MNTKDFWECICRSAGSELHFHCENYQRVPHWESWAGRGEGKFLGAAGPGIISGASQAGGTWCVRDEILWKWESLSRCFLPLFASFPHYLLSCVVPSPSSSAPPTSKPLSQLGDIRRLLADLENSRWKPRVGQCTGVWSHLQAGVGVLGGKSGGAELSWFGLHHFGQLKVCGKILWLKVCGLSILRDCEAIQQVLFWVRWKGLAFCLQVTCPVKYHLSWTKRWTECKDLFSTQRNPQPLYLDLSWSWFCPESLLN